MRLDCGRSTRFKDHNLKKPKQYRLPFVYRDVKIMEYNNVKCFFIYSSAGVASGGPEMVRKFQHLFLMVYGGRSTSLKLYYKCLTLFGYPSESVKPPQKTKNPCHATVLFHDIIGMLFVFSDL